MSMSLAHLRSTNDQRLITTSRYSLGTTIVPSLARLNRPMSASTSMTAEQSDPRTES